MKLPQASASEVVAALEQLGWQVARRGNHIVMKHAERRKAVSIPDFVQAAGIMEERVVGEGPREPRQRGAPEGSAGSRRFSPGRWNTGGPLHPDLGDRVAHGVGLPFKPPVAAGR